MEFLRQARAAASKVVGSASGALGLSDKPDKALEDFVNKLKQLERMLSHMRKAMALMQTKAVSHSGAQLKLAQDIGSFYKASKARQKSVQEFIGVHTQLEKLATSTFSFQFDDIVVSVIDEWEDLSRKTRRYALRTTKEMTKLKKEEQDLAKAKKLCMSLNDKKKLTSEHEAALKLKEKRVVEQRKRVLKMRKELKAVGSKLVDSRYSIFDECFVRLMETQVTYYEEAASAMDSLKAKIEQYRSKRPRVLVTPVQKIIGEVPAALLEGKSSRSPARSPVREQRRMPEPMMRPEPEDEDSPEEMDYPAEDAPAPPARGVSKKKKKKPAPTPVTPEPEPESEPEPEDTSIPLTPQDESALATAKAYKERAVSEFKKKMFENAIKYFSMAIGRMGFGDAKSYDDHRADEVLDFVCSCLSNRAQCNKQLHNHAEIVADATLCLKLKPYKKIVMKCLMFRGLAYNSLGKLQLSLNDLVAARNIGCTTPAVLQTITRLKKAEDVTMPKKIATYESRNRAPSPAPAARTSSKPKPEKKVQNPMSVLPGFSPSMTARPAPSAANHGGQAPPNSGFSIFDDVFTDAPQQTAAPAPQAQPMAGGESSWMNDIHNDTPDIFDPTAGLGNVSSSIPSNVREPQTPGAPDLSMIFGENSKPAKTETKTKASKRNNLFSNGGGGGGGGPVIQEDDGLSGGPIAQTKILLMRFPEQEFWQFAHDNLSEMDYRRIPSRERKVAIEFIVSRGINTPTHISNWQVTRSGKHFQQALDQWEFRAGVRRDLMTLLMNLPSVLGLVEWQGMEWKRVGLGELQDPRKRRKIAMKAMRIVHPDKNVQAPAAQRAICTRVFDALREAQQNDS